MAQRVIANPMAFGLGTLGQRSGPGRSQLLSDKKETRLDGTRGQGIQHGCRAFGRTVVEAQRQPFHVISMHLSREMPMIPSCAPLICPHDQGRVFPALL
ncbi:hypothetical protein D9M68_840780 [compost metagenome]